MDEGFRDRTDAGRRLAERLNAYAGTDAVVLGLARGGVVVGAAVAGALTLPLAALVVRKVGAPRNPELALGAVSQTGQRWIDADGVRATGASPAYLEQEMERQVREAQRREAEYAVGTGPEIARGRDAIVVDDGIATGASALVAVRSAHDLGARRVILATPTASRHALTLLRPEVDDLLCLLTPEPFLAVGFYYREFEQVSDREVVDLLRQNLR